MTPTIEQIKEILVGTPSWQKSYCTETKRRLTYDNYHNLSDLRTILAQHEEIAAKAAEIERLKAAINQSVGNLEYAAFNLCKSMELESKNGGRIVETTCPEKSLLIAIRDLKEATGVGDE